MISDVTKLKPQIWQRSLNVCVPLDPRFERPNPEIPEAAGFTLNCLPVERSREGRNGRFYRKLVGSILASIYPFLVSEKLVSC